MESQDTKRESKGRVKKLALSPLRLGGRALQSAGAGTKEVVKKIGVTKTIMALGITGLSGFMANEILWDNKHAKYEGIELNILAQQKVKANCHPKGLAFHEGVKIRSTPSLYDNKLGGFSQKTGFLKGNVIAKVKKGQTFYASLPREYVTKDEKWASFIFNGSANSDLAEVTAWVNLDPLQTKSTFKPGHPHITEFEVSGVVLNSEGGTDCIIGKNGVTTTSTGQPAAFGYMMGSGDREKSLQLSGKAIE